MIVLRNLTKSFYMRGRRKTVADNINAVFPTNVSVALLGRNGAGKSTLLKLIAGTATPTRGEVLSTGTVSFPVGLASSLHPDLTGAQNTRFVARIYGADTDELIAYVEEFAELGEHFNLPVRSYSSGMRGRLSFGINMGLSFDTYLVDEVTAVGDAAFKRKSRDVFLQRMESAGALFVSHSMGSVREMCQAGALLEGGQLTYYDDVEDAIDRYQQSQTGNRVYTPETVQEGAAEMNFPRDACMFFGIGLTGTNIAWIGDCLRRHRPCHFPKEREPHYFDIRSGQSAAVLKRRQSSANNLAARMQNEQGDELSNTVRLLRRVSETLAIHAAPLDTPTRHDAYLEFLTTGRKTQPVICDFTPDYAVLPEGELKEMQSIGHARFLIVLRDPATRLWTEIMSRLPARKRSVNEGAAVVNKLIDEDTAVLEQYPQSDYVRILSRFDATVRPDRVFCAFHESIQSDTGLAQVCEFLDIPPVPTKNMMPLPDDPIPEAPTEILSSLRLLLADQYDAMISRFGANLPEEWSSKALQ